MPTPNAPAIATFPPTRGQHCTLETAKTYRQQVRERVRHQLQENISIVNVSNRVNFVEKSQCATVASLVENYEGMLLLVMVLQTLSLPNICVVVCVCVNAFAFGECGFYGSVR